MNKYITRKNISASVITGAIITISSLFAANYPEFIVSLFSFPAAKLSSQILGIPYHKPDSLTYTLLHSNILLRIVESCSGFNFWLILFSFFTYRFLNSFPFKRAIKFCAALLPASWLASVLVNTGRVIASLYISKFGSAHLSREYANVLHLWTGIIFFLSALIYIHIISQRRFNNES